ncbi:LuxR C-terminal-related transcriptional regulator [Kitasatospora sp. NPDC018058]|uniref:LuxR C-terminal-related transcriptional regulator n=1 Tax=Kitasatospora sp. NPDC018058 TaxID=3364025 RepID=UPI0037C14608
MANIEESGRLSDEDLELLALLATRPSDEAIARHLDISVRTVRRRVARIMEALNAPNRVNLGA